MIAALAAINLAGAVFGFLWYFEQLAGSPPRLWPVIPDSPLAALYFGVLMLALYRGRRIHWLESLAFFGMFKYGLWTPIVLGRFMQLYGVTSFEEVHLSLSHLGMALAAVIFIRYLDPPPRTAVPVWLWYVFNDYMDYTRGTYPFLPADELLPLARDSAYLLTASGLALYFLLRGSALRPARLTSAHRRRIVAQNPLPPLRDE